MNEITISAVSAADIPEIAEAEAVIFSDAWSEKSLSDSFESESSVFLAARNGAGELVGYGIEYCLPGESEILNLAVLPKFRRLGFGRQILSKLLEIGESRGADVCFLEVRASNTAAKTLYEEFGFTAVGIRKRYYTSPVEDAIEMILQR